MLGDFAGQLRGRRLVERAERDRVEQTVAFEIATRRPSGGIVLLLLGAHGADDEAARAGRRAQEVLEPLDRVRVRPLQVVEDEHQRRGRSERLRQRLEEAQPLPAFELQPPASGTSGRAASDLGTEPGDVGEHTPARALMSVGCSASLFSQAAIGA